MIQRIRRKEVKFEESQFYLIQVNTNNEGFYQFIDKETLHVICATSLDRMESCMLNIFKKYKSYDILNRRLKKMEFYQMSEEERENRHKECRVQGERLSYLVDECISIYYKSLEDKTTTKRTLVNKVSSIPTTEKSIRPQQAQKRPPEDNKPVTRPLKKRRPIRSL